MAGRVVSVSCPACGRKVPFEPASRWRPFCSERCKTLDLGAWAAERYRIAGESRDPQAHDVDPAAGGTGGGAGTPPTNGSHD